MKLLILTFTLLAAQTAGAKSVDKKALQMLAEEARVIALETKHCGTCHGDAEHEGDAEALGVFDLREQRWFRGLDADQLDGGLTRIRSRVDKLKLLRWTEFVRIAKRALVYGER